VGAQPAATLPLIIVPTRLAPCSSSPALARSVSIPIVAVAGSNGKTTTKEMTAAILAQMGPCLATHGNLNNHIGVPLTLLRLEPGRIAARSSRSAPIASARSAS
jgi:UDP-N-acetylmuramoyl-tripeptide--D-alanyl-D-alanine ligase